MSYLTYSDVEPMDISEVEVILTDSESRLTDSSTGPDSCTSDDDFRCFPDDDGGHSDDDDESGGSADAVLLYDSDPDSERANIAMSDD